MALFHHPLSWLREFDRKKVRAILTAPDACHFLLNGHLHDTELALQFSPGSQTAQLAAGACWQGSGWPHAVTVGRLDFDKQMMHLHVFTYSDKEGGFWGPDTQLSRNMPNGVWTEPFPKGWTFPARGTTPTKQKVPLIPQAWRKHLQTQCGHIDAMVEMETPRPCKLNDIYVSLKTGWQEPEKRDQPKDEKEAEASPRRPLETLADHPKYRHFAIVGGPGAGKTTFVRHMALNVLKRETVLPLLLPLKDFGTWLNGDKGKKPGLLVDWAQELLGEHGLKDLSSRIGQGQALWLLDGLDEIFDEERRLQAVEIISAVTRHQTLGADRLLLTTRPHALDKPVVRQSLGLEKQTAQILDLDAADQRTFLIGWFKALYPEEPEDAAKRRDDLWQKMDRHESLADLRGTPLLLSMIAAIYHLGKTLPERRADLYEKAIENLLQRRYGLRARIKGSDRLVREMRRALMTTALWMMEHDAVREIGERDLVNVLGKDSFPAGSPDWSRWADVEELAVDLGAHSGLLTMKNNRFSFIHLGFQEYLAARAIAYEKEAEIYLARKFKVGKWREVILLTVGALYESLSGRQGEKLIRTILGKGKDCGAIALAVKAAAQAPPGELGILEKELKDQAVNIIENGASSYSEKDRCDLGLALGHLGDPRLGLMREDNWIELTTPDGRTYRLAKYLTTNQDFKAFIQSGGYTTETWWDEEGHAWLEEAMPDADNRYSDEWWNKRFNAPNQPVVGVSWYEARAFCRWLAAELTGGEGWLPDEWEIRLPNMAEWSHAAGEGRREYPWGDEEPDETRANYNQRLNKTSPVGLYPNGVAGGVHDLGGNAWEWNLDLESEGIPFWRGGSWAYLARVLASSYRDWVPAGYRYRSLGFRCCLAPRALES
ncbi:MAG: SUMF1/EgtB/PvdO family nonheme iron enzyme [Acidobacteriota bacterium]|nr:SUMF1/EgtB/PvdO family nonheme iron enzyme [Acidobacteriota bacterium]